MQESIHRIAVSCTSTESTCIPASTNSSPLETINVIFLVPSAPQSNTQQQCHRKPPADSIPSSLTSTLGQACHQLDRPPPEGHITILRQGLPSRHSSQPSVSTGPTAHPGCCWGGTGAFKSGQGMGKADPRSKQTLPCAPLPAPSGPGSTPPGPHLCFQTATGTVGRSPSLWLPPVSLTWLVPLTHTCPCPGERGLPSAMLPPGTACALATNRGGERVHGYRVVSWGLGRLFFCLGQDSSRTKAAPSVFYLPVWIQHMQIK